MVVFTSFPLSINLLNIRSLEFLLLSFAVSNTLTLNITEETLVIKMCVLCSDSVTVNVFTTQ